jgi:hypothetical protein
MLSDSIDLKSLFRFMTEGFQERPLSQMHTIPDTMGEGPSH